MQDVKCSYINVLSRLFIYDIQYVYSQKLLLNKWAFESARGEPSCPTVIHPMTKVTG